MCDELFRESDDDSEMLEKSWKKTIDGINKDGYRAGIDVGQEECVQEGFNAAFSQSSNLLFSIAELRGTVSGKLSYNLLQPGKLSADQEQLLQTLLGDILEYETELLNFSKELFTKTKLNCGHDRECDKTDSGTCDELRDTNNTTEQRATSDLKDMSVDGISGSDPITKETEVKANEMTRCDREENKFDFSDRVRCFKTRLNEILTTGN